MEQLRSCDLLLKLIGHPQDLETNLLRYAASIIFTLAYGKQLKDNDEDLNALMGLVESFSEDCRPGAHLVDTFPILDSLPDILAPWRNDARMKHCKELEVSSLCDIPTIIQLIYYILVYSYSSIFDFYQKRKKRLIVAPAKPIALPHDFWEIMVISNSTPSL